LSESYCIDLWRIFQEILFPNNTENRAMSESLEIGGYYCKKFRDRGLLL
jgi:hypothetical protein